jgi:hypothetical protein
MYRRLLELLKLVKPRQPHLPQTNVIHSITCGERDKNGFADTYVNGEKTNVRMLLWTEEEIERLHKIADKIHKENGSK